MGESSWKLAEAFLEGSHENAIAHRRLAFTNLSTLSKIVHMIYSARVLIGSLSIRAYIGTCLHSEYDRAEMEIEG